MQKFSKKETEQSDTTFQECTVSGDWWTDLSSTNCWFPKHKDYPTVKYRREEYGNKGNINPPNAPDDMPINEENLLSLCIITFKFLNQVMRYAQYYFENKLWNKNEMLEYLITCCILKNFAFKSIVAFQ